jgi:uncharacterized membrane protein
METPRPLASPLPVRTVRTLQPLHWLELAWHDIRLYPGIGMLHGGALAFFGAILVLLAHDRFWALAGALSGFLLIAPLMATGLYAVSRAIARGEPGGWDSVLVVWQSLDPRLVKFGALLALAGTGWVLTSAALITLKAPVPIQTPIDFLRHIVAARGQWLFEAWLMLGALMAAPIFASSVVSLPLLMDRPGVGVLQAVLTSWRAIMVNPIPMAVWAFLVMGFTVLGLASMLLGLVFVIPMLGHASWYAYRDLVGTEQV